MYLPRETLDRHFPLPLIERLIERQRYLTDGQGISWRLEVGGQRLQYRVTGAIRWCYTNTIGFGPLELTHQRLNIWRDLLAQPTELVEYPDEAVDGQDTPSATASPC